MLAGQFPDSVKDGNDAVEKLGAEETGVCSTTPNHYLSGVCASDYLDDVKNIYANGHGRGASQASTASTSCSRLPGPVVHSNWYAQLR